MRGRGIACPHCAVALAPHDPGYSCPARHGLFLPRRVARRALGRAAVRRLRVVLRPAPTGRPCPACSVPMRVLPARGAEIDRCPGCRGLRLDRGEMERIEAARPDRIDVFTFEAWGDVGGQVVLEVVAGLLEGI